MIRKEHVLLLCRDHSKEKSSKRRNQPTNQALPPSNHGDGEAGGGRHGVLDAATRDAGRLVGRSGVQQRDSWSPEPSGRRRWQLPAPERGDSNVRSRNGGAARYNNGGGSPGGERVGDGELGIEFDAS
ncbi:hypothetical protein GUJ93_ZPchr0008g12255 [Zizania palustris]|uniref:Uncharacterized protein n=1 Tax=Zizania palustris TaxID=103762 RepID=A0A8J5QXH6_ZIZPA|nr:hypothetical protein GUJ93_ZPchr0008g12255 [Zizania palustris]